MIVAVRKGAQFDLEVDLAEPMNPEVMPLMVADDLRHASNRNFAHQLYPSGFNYKVFPSDETSMQVSVIPYVGNTTFKIRWESGPNRGQPDLERATFEPMLKFYRDQIPQNAGDAITKRENAGEPAK